MYNIVGALFNEESEARQAMAALSENPQINGTTIYQISLVKRKEGVLRLCDNFSSEYLKSDDAADRLLEEFKNTRSNAELVRNINVRNHV